jgi:hypothetical protein
MGAAGQEGEEAGKRNRALAKGKMVALFGVVVVEVDADEARGEAAEVLFVIDQAEELFGGGVAEIVPVAEGGGGKFLQDDFPEIVGRDFPGILAAFEAEAEAEGAGFFPEAEEDFLDTGPGGGESGLGSANRGELFADEAAGADLAGGGEDFEFVRSVAVTGRAEVKDNEAGADGGGGLEGGEGVALGEAAGGFARGGEFEGVGVGAENLNGDGAEVVKNLDPGHAGLEPAGKDAGPEAEAGVVAEFDGGEAEVGGLAEQGLAVGGAVGMPAGGEGEGWHRLMFQDASGQGEIEFKLYLKLNGGDLVASGG